MKVEVKSKLRAFKSQTSVYNVVEVTDKQLSAENNIPMSSSEFSQRMLLSLNQWSDQGANSCVLNIHKKQAHLIPTAVKLGFDFHHVKDEELYLSCLLNAKDPLPIGPRHFIGVAGMALRKKNKGKKKYFVLSDFEVLVIREKSGPSANFSNFFKLPGGLVDPHENLSEAVVREVREETGLETIFLSIANIQELHHFSKNSNYIRSGCTDLYTICLVEPLNPEQQLTPQEKEIAECKWMNLEQYLNSTIYKEPGTSFHIAMHEAARLHLERINREEPVGLIKSDAKFRKNIDMSLNIYHTTSKL
eukprot:augustus_masked-scaffold_18-processed-gene-1.59-mRNA-1 protein AED:0.08 eAED:0.08 QI:0/-1/0/1/-1/1/1/0/303